MNLKTVAFCGHGKLAGEPVNLIRQIVYSETEKLIRQGASEFLLGGYGDFDILCAEIIAELKKTYVNINSVLVISYLNRKYDTSLYDCTDYPNIEKVPKSLAILKRNEYMVQKSDAIIAYVKYTLGGASKTLAYAQKKKKQIINVNELIDSDCN